MSKARSGDYAGIQEHLEQGFPPDVIDTYGNTPIYRAAYNGHREAVELLLKHGADALIRNDKGLTAKTAAQRGGGADIAALLP